jgi:hypothetical protein
MIRHISGAEPARGEHDRGTRIGTAPGDEDLMSLLLTCHVDQYRIDVDQPFRLCFRPDRLGTGGR